MGFELVPLGLVAGALTTVAGQGGGLLLLLALSSLKGPHVALAMSTPALLLGNFHRAYLSRRFVDLDVAKRFLLGALPGSFLGGLFAGLAPAWLVRAFLLVMTALTLAKAAGWLKFSVPRRAFPFAGLGIGALTGTSGGAGVLLSPVLLASGLTGPIYIGTQSLIAALIHTGRLLAYGTSGLLGAFDFGSVALLTFSLFVGNALGEAARARLKKGATVRLELGMLAICTLLAVSGIAT